jgi:hypothetical protein
VAAAESEPPEETAAVMQRHTEAGAARDRRASLDRRGFGVERDPYGLLTMIVSLEAIFLSTFVMISQNRADAKRQAIADQQEEASS